MPNKLRTAKEQSCYMVFFCVLERSRCSHVSVGVRVTLHECGCYYECGGIVSVRESVSRVTVVLRKGLGVKKKKKKDAAELLNHSLLA